SVCLWPIDLKSTLLLQKYLMTCSEYFTQCCMLMGILCRNWIFKIGLFINC
uniref:Uncharacterized protein n=1 Tax=Amphimedon queenslandica TaxID=400682 RepID=A0A1X7U2V2_AMPQE